jgi:hypothetical protein
LVVRREGAVTDMAAGLADQVEEVLAAVVAEAEAAAPVAVEQEDDSTIIYDRK